VGIGYEEMNVLTEYNENEEVEEYFCKLNLIQK